MGCSAKLISLERKGNGFGWACLSDRQDRDQGPGSIQSLEPADYFP